MGTLLAPFSLVPSRTPGVFLSIWVCLGRHCDLLKNSCLTPWPHTMPLSFVDCSKWSRSYSLSNCDLSIWYLPIITWIPSTKSFLYICAKTIKRMRMSALMSLKTAPLLKISSVFPIINVLTRCSFPNVVFWLLKLAPTQNHRTQVCQIITWHETFATAFWKC